MNQIQTHTHTWQKGIDRKKIIFGTLLRFDLHLYFYCDIKIGFYCSIIVICFYTFFVSLASPILALYLWVLWVVTGYSSILWLILWCSQLSNPRFSMETFVFVTGLLFDTITYVRSYRFQIFIRFAVFFSQKTVSQLRSWYLMYMYRKVTENQ